MDGDPVEPGLPIIRGMTLIGYDDWYGAGGTRTQLQQALGSGMLRRIRRGVLTDATESTPASDLYLLRVHATAAYLDTGTYFSHVSAAALHGLPLLSKRRGEVTVVRTRGGHGSVHPSLHSRAATLDPSDVCELDGLPTTTLTRTLADLARMLPFDEAVMLLDAGLRAGAEKDALLVRTAAGRGCRLAERAITFADGDAESPGESLSRVRMHQAGLVMPVLQKAILDADGQFVGRSDFFWEHVPAIGEFDGRVKYDELAPTREDLIRVVTTEKDREQSVGDTGCRVLRWGWSDLWNGGMVRRLAPVVGYASSPRATVSVKRRRAGWSF